MSEINLENIVRVLFVAFSFAVLPMPSKTNEWDSIFIATSIGLLTVIIVFYSLIMRKDIKDKSRQLIISEWDGIVPQFSKKLNEIKSISGDIKTSPQSYKKMQEELLEIQNIFTRFGVYYEKFELNEKLNRCVLGLFASILTLLPHLMLYNPELYNEYVKWIGVIGVISFIGGTYYFMEILITWKEITSYDGTN